MQNWKPSSEGILKKNLKSKCAELVMYNSLLEIEHFEHMKNFSVYALRWLCKAKLLTLTSMQSLHLSQSYNN